MVPHMRPQHTDCLTQTFSEIPKQDQGSKAPSGHLPIGSSTYWSFIYPSYLPNEPIIRSIYFYTLSTFLPSLPNEPIIRSIYLIYLLVIHLSTLSTLSTFLPNEPIIRSIYLYNLSTFLPSLPYEPIIRSIYLILSVNQLKYIIIYHNIPQKTYKT